MWNCSIYIAAVKVKTYTSGASVYSGHVYSAYYIAKNVFRGRVLCVRWIYSSGDNAVAQVEDTKCSIETPIEQGTKWWRLEACWRQWKPLQTEPSRAEEHWWKPALCPSPSWWPPGHAAWHESHQFTARKHSQLIVLLLYCFSSKVDHSLDITVEYRQMAYFSSYWFTIVTATQITLWWTLWSRYKD